MQFPTTAGHPTRSAHVYCCGPRYLDITLANHPSYSLRNDWFNTLLAGVTAIEHLALALVPLAGDVPAMSNLTRVTCVAPQQFVALGWTARRGSRHDKDASQVWQMCPYRDGCVGYVAAPGIWTCPAARSR